MTKDIKLYYTSDGYLLTEGAKNVIPIITKLSNYAYRLNLITPIDNKTNTIYAIFEKSNGEVSDDYLMSYVGTESVIFKGEEQTWYKYSCYIEDKVLDLPTYDKSNVLKIGFKVEFSTGQYDLENKEIMGKFNFIPYNASCVYTITTRVNTNDSTSIQKVIDYLKENYYTKLEVEGKFETYITQVLNEPV